MEQPRPAAQRVLQPCSRQAHRDVLSAQKQIRHWQGSCCTELTAPGCAISTEHGCSAMLGFILPAPALSALELPPPPAGDKLNTAAGREGICSLYKLRPSLKS